MLSRRTLLAASAILPVIHTGRAWAELPKDDTTAKGFERSTVIAWGDRVEPDSPPFTPAALTADAAARQFGWDGIVLGVKAQPPGEDGVARAIMVVAHPAPLARMLPLEAQNSAVMRGLSGASVLNLENHDQRWLITDGGFQTRRLTADTICRITGPGQKTLGDAGRGPVAPSSGCLTPWGTALVGETPGDARSGYVVEFDPNDPDALASKRTGLGRFVRAGIAAGQTSDGRAVILMSEDAAAGRLLRFISRAPVTTDNPAALDDGILSVAVLRGTSLDFVTVHGEQDITSASTFDAPAGIALLPNGGILLACRGVVGVASGDPALGEGNPDGRILLLRPEGGQIEASRYSVELALSGGDTGMGGASVLRPSSLLVGLNGDVWIGGEGSGIALAQDRFTKIAQVYRQPLGALIGGLALGPQGTPLFASVRHPGATNDASFGHPATRWPTLRPDMPPQTVVVALHRTR
ncbi:MAG: DUF839 domain-containing protein [Acetobacteraceae bacterium]|nr:DUF839 domain-containing protein [Acetobacteraceae bacterium]